MKAETTLLKLLDDAGKVKALDDVVRGQATLLLVLASECYLVSKDKSEALKSALEAYRLKDRQAKPLSSTSYFEPIGVFLRKDIEHLLEPWHCLPGERTIENGESVARVLRTDLLNTDVFFPFIPENVSIDHCWSIRANITEVHETWELFVDDNFILDDLAVSRQSRGERFDLIRTEMLRYFAATEESSWNFRSCIEFLLRHPDISTGENGALCWCDYNDSSRETKRKTLQNRFISERNDYKNCEPYTNEFPPNPV